MCGPVGLVSIILDEPLRDMSHVNERGRAAVTRRSIEEAEPPARLPGTDAKGSRFMRLQEIAEKAGNFAWWRGYVPWAHPLANRLAARWGLASRLVRWPVPALAPYRRDELHLSRNYGLGDVLMCTPAMREIKRLNPACRITFYTDFPDLVEGLPFIDRVRPMAEQPEIYVWLNYEFSLPPHRHLARIIGDQLGVDVRDVRPSCAVRPDLVERFRNEWSDLPRPHVIVTRRASSFTPNKDWPDAYWDALVARLADRGTVIEVGGPTPGPPVRAAGSYLDLRGRTSLPELIAAIAASDLHVGPITGTVHIAAAMGVPTVVIYGGYEHPDCTDYPGNINFYSPVECAPCWLREPCPYGKKCLHQITPEQVLSAVDQLGSNLEAQQPTRRARPVEDAEGSAGPSLPQRA